MEMLNNYYLTSNKITDDEINTFITQNPLGSNPKETINTQAWILHFHNPAEAWANVRRSDCPKLTPPDPEGKNKLINGNDIPVRLCYPIKEETYSKDAYQEAKNRVAGDYTWNAPLWWDVQ